MRRPEVSGKMEKEGEGKMTELDHITEQVLKQIDGDGFRQEGAYNLRQNGISLCHGDQ